MTLYRAIVVMGEAHAPDYVTLHMQKGEAVQIHGKPMVDVGGYYVQAKGWHESEAEARRQAADEIERITTQMLAVAARTREAAA